MKKGSRKKPAAVREYDFSGGIRGKYADQYAKGTNIVLLDPDLGDVFADSKSVNQTLRAIAKIVRSRTKPAHAAKR